MNQIAAASGRLREGRERGRAKILSRVIFDTHGENSFTGRVLFARISPLRFAALLVAATLSTAASVRAVSGLVERPLAARSGPREATLFKLMPADRTGIVTENPYDDPKMWGELYQQFVYGSIGTGVAIGDFDNDGRPDLFVVNKSGQGRLFRNLGDWHFEDVTEKAGLMMAALGSSKDKPWFGLAASTDTSGVPWSQGATFVDVNNDGLLDLYICRFNAPNLLYINQGNGTFKEEAAARGLAIVDSSVMAAFCDYDRDGSLDLYLQTNLLDPKAHPVGQPDFLFHNNGDGSFTNVTAKAGIAGETQGHSAIWWDFDQDGWPDLYVANDFVVPDFLYRNNHDGTFTNVIHQVVPHMPHSSMGADLGDVNNDGLIDLIVADMAASSHEKDQRGLAQIRSKLNGATVEPGRAPQYMRNSLYINTGTGRMWEAAYLAGLAKTNWTWSVLLADLDNDGRLDAFFTNGTVREFHNIDLEQRISASESFADEIRAIKETPPLNEPNMVFRNRGDLRFEEVGHTWGLDQNGVSFGAALGDLDGDGDLDLVFSNYQGGVTVMRNDSDQGHRVIVELRGTKSNRFGIGATVKIETVSGTQIRPLVLARGYLSSSEPVIHFGLGEDPLIKTLTVDWPSGLIQRFDNLSVDRRYTITEGVQDVAPSATATPRQPLFVEVGHKLQLDAASAELPDTEAKKAELRVLRGGHRGPSLAVGNVSRADQEDIIVGATTAAPRRWYQQNADGATTPVRAPWGDATPLVDDGPILILDVNEDGAADVLVTKSGTAAFANTAEYRTSLWLGDGHGGLVDGSQEHLPAIEFSVGAAAAADFEHSGRLGVFLGGNGWPAKYPLAPPSVLLANRDGRLVDVTDTAAPTLREIGLVTSALWSDVDGDGFPDLIVAVKWGTVHYFHNDGTGHLEDWTERAGFGKAGQGWWTSLATADFNQDGRPDFVAGNVGLNTPYRASPEEPALLYYGSFAPGTGLIAMETETENGQVFPRITRNEIAEKIPAILRKFPRNDDYARAPLSQLFSADRLAKARVFRAAEFQSGVFLSQADGTYAFTPFPRIAQIAPFESVVAGDFDGDGYADIYAAQNSFAPLPATGHFDGGLSQLLRGDGHGHFTPVSPQESGLVVPGDARAVSRVDSPIYRGPVFLVTRNDDTTLAYAPVRAGGSFIKIVLNGSEQNREAIGATVTLELSDQTRETAEICAGQGVFSQTAASCLFGYKENARPVQLTIRWPGGQTTKRDLRDVRPLGGTGPGTWTIAAQAPHG